MRLTRFLSTLGWVAVIQLAPAQIGMQPIRNPKADVFRAREKAFLLSPARPVEAFDHVLSVKLGVERSPWLLIEHRSHDAANPQETQLSFYNPSTRKTCSFPHELNIPPKGWSIRDGDENTVIVDSVRYLGESNFAVGCWAIRCDTGQTMPLSGVIGAWLVDNERILVAEPTGLFLRTWSGDSQLLDFQGWRTDVHRTNNRTLFLIDWVRRGGSASWHSIDFKSNQEASITAEVAEELRAETRPTLTVNSHSSSGAPRQQTGWLLSSNMKASVSPYGAGVLEHRRDKRLPHQLDSQARISENIGDNGSFKPAGVLITADPKQDLVWFVRDHQLFLRDLVPISLAEYETYVRDVVQERAMELAKTAVLAFRDLASRNDGTFPARSEGGSALSRYVRDRKLRDRITYLGNGEKTTGIENISNTLMGYVDTPYGRATFAWDSSTRWVPRP